MIATKRPATKLISPCIGVAAALLVLGQDALAEKVVRKKTAAAPPSAEQSKKEGTLPGPKVPSPPLKTVEGPSIRPSAALLEWLGKNARTEAGKRRRIKLPAVVRFQGPSRLAISGAHIGGQVGAPEADAIALTLDDSGMGRPLIEQLRERCPKTGDVCALWLIGYWGRLVEVQVPAPPGPAGAKKWPFAVLGVGDVLEDKGQALRVHIETES